MSAFELEGSRPHYTRSRSYDALHLRLEVKFYLGERRIEGEATHTIRSLREGLELVSFDQVGLQVRSVALEGQGPCSFTLTQDALHVRLPRPLSLNEEARLTIAYEARPQKGLYFIVPDDAYPNRPLQCWSQGEDEDNRYWFPCYDNPNDKLTSELIAWVPRGFLAISNGRLVSRRDEGEWSIYHWSQEQPHTSYLISVAVGRFSELREEVDGLPLLYYVPEGREEDARRSFKDMADMVRFYNALLGYPYPYPKYAQTTVHDFIYGGMENTSATTLTELALLDGKASRDHTVNPLLAHELVHQWFGDLITCKHWSHAWLNEGFATYFENLYVWKSLGQEEFWRALMEDFESYKKEVEERYSRPIVCRVYENPNELFDRHLYEKAGLVLHTLRYYMGEESFWRGIRAYVKRFAFCSVDTEDFRKALEEETGLSLEQFFEEWFYRPGHLRLKARQEYDPSSGLLRLELQQLQEQPYHIPLDVFVYMEKGEARFRLQLSEKAHVFYLPLDSRPLSVSIDRELWVMKELEHEKPVEMWLYDLEHGNAVEKIMACRALASAVDYRAEEALIRALKGGGFWYVRGQAALALGRRGGEGALRALLEALGEPHHKLRRMVVQALGHFKDRRVVEALRPVLQGDESYFVQAEAAISLGKTKRPEALEVLLGALSLDSYGEVVRQGVMQGLAELGQEGALEEVKKWASYGRPHQVRAAAVRCLAKLGKGKEWAFDLLVEALKDYWYAVRIAAAEGLKQWGDAKAIPFLEEALKRELQGRVRRAIREALHRLRTPIASQELDKLRQEIERLREENTKLRERLERLEAALAKGPAS